MTRTLALCSSAVLVPAIALTAFVISGCHRGAAGAPAAAVNASALAEGEEVAEPAADGGLVAEGLVASPEVAQNPGRTQLTVGFLPVTCHLTCPVTNWVTAHSDKGSVFRSKKYTDFATVAEEFKSGKLKASFILAPLAMALRRQGLPIKMVYLGHRDGTTIIVPKDSPAKTLADLKGKRIAIPHNYSNQRILLVREMDRLGMKPEDLTMIVVPPPEHPSMLQKGAIDAYIIGEPHAAKAEMDGFGRVLCFTKDIWPNFISCVLAVSEDLIKTNRPLVKELVDGIAASGKWIDGPGTDLATGVVREGEGKEDDSTAVLPKDWESNHRNQAAIIASRKEYYAQKSELLKFVLSKPPDRVRYVNLVPLKGEFEEIQKYAEKLGYFKPSTEDDPFGFYDYCDPSFATKANAPTPGGGGK
jgi:NitT/TauT family transport system substrate-binding protein